LNNLKTVTIIAPARLHMGFFDLSGSLGRNFGSIGVALQEMATHLVLTSAPALTVNGESAQRAQRCLQELCQTLKVSDALSLTVHKAIPEHAGLGSGTQMALAVGMALNRFYDLQLSVPDIAELTDRGRRSGIGIGVFEQGGLVLDGGRGVETRVPPVLARLAFPESWRFILVLDQRSQGLHGDDEIRAFNELPEFPQQEAARLCHLLLMQGLPAIAEQQIEAFGHVISQLQQSVGQHFAPVQGGVFYSAEVAEIMNWLARQGAVGIGQTSWGPTGFCLFNEVRRADNLVQQLNERYHNWPHLRFLTVSAQNTGADIKVVSE
jgi:beta-ribofuranosylaminobenzene 5'-phosphate synthase